MPLFSFLLLLPTFVFAPLTALANEMSFEIGGKQPTFNTPFVSVTICEEGKQRCKTVDRIVFDTGSSGLRILKSSLKGLRLDHVKTSSGDDVLGCAEMAGGSGFWGPLAKADIQLGDETARSAKFQIVDDSTRIDGVVCKAFTKDGRNGILGMGPGLTIPHGLKLYVNGQPFNDLSFQPPNLVSLFERDNNGFSVTLPEMSGEAVKSVKGKIIFGINTRENNRPHRDLSVCTVKPDQFMNIRHGGETSMSMIDTGSFAYILPVTQTWLPKCESSDAYLCPNEPVQQTAELLNTDGTVCGKVDMRVNAYEVGREISHHNKVFPRIANAFGGGASKLFIMGLPFFFGRQVYYVLDKADSDLGHGPLVAF